MNLSRFMIGMLFLCLLPTVSAFAQRKPNIIVIMADDLGMESLECCGGTSFKTPRFNELARRGMQFTRCYSQPLCTPSRVKIMTGRSNARNYVDFGHLDKSEITFGTILKRAGYKTAIAGKWQLTGGGGRTGKKDGTGSYPDDCGFDETCIWSYEHDVSVADAQAYYAKYPEQVRRRMSRFWYPAVIQNGRMIETRTDDFGPDLFSNFLLDFIERHRDEPFFAYYPMVLTHNPFVPTPITDGIEDMTLAQRLKANNRYFPDMVRYTGVILERFLSKLDQLGIAENTIVLFTTDNGNHRSLVYRMGDRIVIGGKGLPLDAGCHVPMFAWWKGTIGPGSRCDDLVDLSDILPTVAQAGGAKLPEDRELDGSSFLAVLAGEKHQGPPYQRRQAVFVHYDRNPAHKKPQFRRIRFAHDGRFKLYQDGKLFDVTTDFEELRPISPDSQTAAASQARMDLQQVLDQMPEWSPDNSSFQDQPSRAMRQRRNRLQKLKAESNSR